MRSTRASSGRSPLHLIKIIPHGSLKDRYPSFSVMASTPAEALEGWSRQTDMVDIPAYMRPVVQVVDHETDAELYEETEVTELHIVPAMFGGGAIGKIIIGVVIIAAIVFSGGTWTPLAVAILMAGVSIALSGVMELFMKTPKVDKSKDPEASKYLGNGGNTIAIGTPIGFGGGRMKIGGQLLSVQVDSNALVHGQFPVTPT